MSYEPEVEFEVSPSTEDGPQAERRHRTTDPACRLHRPPRGRIARWRYDRNRGWACQLCEAERTALHAAVVALCDPDLTPGNLGEPAIVAYGATALAGDLARQLHELGFAVTPTRGGPKHG